MDSDKERLQTAKWVLERNLGWIAAAEVKVGVVVAIDTAMLGALSATFSAAATNDRTAWAYLFVVLAASLLLVGLFCTAMAVLPRISGPAQSLLFFGRIGPREQLEYQSDFSRTTTQDMLSDLTAQIHRNAQIACEKFAWVRKAMMWSFLSVVPWFSALATLLHK